MTHPMLPPSASPRTPKLADRLARPFIRFMELEIASAVLLLLMTTLALLWANSPIAGSYEKIWVETPLGIRLGDFFELELSLREWVNDGLMGIFFFAVGMEIKREMIRGELSTRSKAMLPVFGALGGMIVPAGVYLFFHYDTPAERGWGIPMATDIAFAMAALSVLGRHRVPMGLRVFLLALAIGDDLGAVTVIALAYTKELHLDALSYALSGLALCVALNAIGVRSFLVYFVIGGFVWFETHHSGVHATIAGVALGLITPTQVDDEENESLVERARGGIETLTALVSRRGSVQQEDHSGHQRHHLFRLLSDAGRRSLSPLDFLVNVLERPVAFFIMPVFALANAGVAINAEVLGEPGAQGVALAVALGLLIGKPVGIVCLCRLAVKLRIATLPAGVNWGMITAAGILAGIGFTVSLFITSLAFEDANYVAGSKIGILAGSLLATLIGVLVLKASLPGHRPPQQAEGAPPGAASP